MQMNKNIESICKTFTTLVGKVTAKKLFLGYGLYHSESLMFGIYHCDTDRLFIRAESDSLVKYIKSLGAKQWIKGEPTSAISYYYSVPESIKQNHHLYQRVLIASISELKEKRTLEELNRKNRLREMVNFSLKHERLLAKVGIPDVKTFRSVGPITTYVRLKKKMLPISKKFFWVLVGALKNKLVEALTENEKKAALNMLNKALIKEGLKPIRFKESK
ncbi:TfoX/Sxy family DNA transformation protein [Conservatibacter flavescens]|uniref:DNA transformation protein n=1 Tax=Conservatibacter flavescens TaxID=28161 RepID=A0A2M8S1L6_9PAST|nr:TfoX/Sxy family DNA transformation protein [Conservatibacter flavescens]PJG85033.1 DNA transformation protein [Conservatibacter flavescens]